MQSLLQIGERVEKRVIERHAETITRFLDILDIRIDNLKEEWQKCSYATALGPYVDAKLTLHKLHKMWYDNYDGVQNDYWENIWLRMDRTKDNVQKFRETMYDNVCGECSHCKTRRKCWPAGTVIKNARKVLDQGGFKLVMKMLENPPSYTMSANLSQDMEALNITPNFTVFKIDDDLQPDYSIEDICNGRTIHESK